MDVDQEHFTTLYEALHPRVLAYALGRVPPHAARDAVDEAFLIAWRKRDQLPQGGELPWLLVTIRNVIANQNRRAGRQDALAEELTRINSPHSTEAIESTVLERMTVLSALAELTERDRESLLLTVWDGLSARDAAAVSGCSTATFTVRLHRARRRFADAIERMDRKPTSVGGVTVQRLIASGKEER